MMNTSVSAPIYPGAPVKIPGTTIQVTDNGDTLRVDHVQRDGTVGPSAYYILPTSAKMFCIANPTDIRPWLPEWSLDMTWSRDQEGLLTVHVIEAGNREFYSGSWE